MKDVIVVDPWLNFVDFAPNAAKRYTGNLLRYVLNKETKDDCSDFQAKELYIEPDIYQHDLDTKTINEIKSELSKAK
ncbi:MAG: hypothetical protein MJ237_05075 [bacterium]|nr:hypothetical protein [bacterium]